MTLPRNPRPHLVLPENLTSTTAYRAPNGGGRKFSVPDQQRVPHAQALRRGLASVATRFDKIKPELQNAGWDGGFGITVRFTSFPDVQLAIDSLEQKSQGIELMSVREVGNKETIATVWIPEGKLQVFETKIADYLAEKRNKNGDRLDNQKFLDAIRDIRTAVIEDLWVGEGPMPADNEVARFEAWISTPRSDGRHGRKAPPVYASGSTGRTHRPVPPDRYSRRTCRQRRRATFSRALGGPTTRDARANSRLRAPARPARRATACAGNP